MNAAICDVEPVATAGKQELILASASPVRLSMLRAAGVGARSDPAGVDEDEVKASLRGAGATTASAAEALAELKAQKVSRRHPGGLVLGADQMLECEGNWLDKPGDIRAARAQLLTLRGRTHRLASSAVAVRDGARLWHHAEEATLTMRPFTDTFLEAYLAAGGPGILQSVGAYQLEGAGAQLFARIRGDYFAILGLPLLPLLDFLRAQGLLTE